MATDGTTTGTGGTGGPAAPSAAAGAPATPAPTRAGRTLKAGVRPQSPKALLNIPSTRA